MPGTSSQTTSVRRNDEAQRYELTVDGRLAGFTAYLDRDGHRVFYHTVIKKEFEGRGLSSVLVKAALTDTRENGERVLGVCPLVAHYLTKHPEFNDITDPVTPDVVTWVSESQKPHSPGA